MRDDEGFHTGQRVMDKTAIYLGIDCGATTTKFSVVDAEGNILSEELHQRPTRSSGGSEAILSNWLEGSEAFLASIGEGWGRVEGVGLAMPGPYEGYGILGKMPNMPASLTGWRFLDDLAAALARAAGRPIPVVTANDGQLAGVGEAALFRKQNPGSVLMLAPGSGLGASYVNAEGFPLSGDHGAAVILCHMPAPYERLGLPAFRCGCGRDWGCFEAYTTISGLPRMLEHIGPRHPGHPLHASALSEKEKVLSLRGLAQEGDPLALEIFDLQARAMGLAVAAGCMAYDPSHVIIGGGLMDPDATTPEFRARYLEGIRKSATEYLWVKPEDISLHQASLGERAQAVGAALLARSS
jgi:predicted NBD/HSP70 family sugar kinase